jgi:hypothetical protein
VQRARGKRDWSLLVGVVHLAERGASTDAAVVRVKQERFVEVRAGESLRLTQRVLKELHAKFLVLAPRESRVLPRQPV